MFFLQDLSNFARPLGKRDTKPRLRKRRINRLAKAIWNPNTAGAIANGAQIGGAIGLVTSNPGNTFKRTVAGTAIGLGAGTGLGVYRGYRYYNNKRD